MCCSYMQCVCKHVGKRVAWGSHSERAREGSPPGPWEQRKERLVSLSGEDIHHPSHKPMVHSGLIIIS